MKTLLKISDAAAIAIHACVLLGENPGKPVPAPEIAKTFRVSSAHAAKVLQRLEKAGVIKAVRGPAGGFLLRGDPRKIRLRRVLEAIEGPLEPADCLLGRTRCLRSCCMLGNFLAGTRREFAKMLWLTLHEASLKSYGKSN